MKPRKRALAAAVAMALTVTATGVGVGRSLFSASADSFNQSLVDSFTDIKGHWASNALTTLIGYGYMKGVGDNIAAPNDTLTTSQIIALLVRIMGGSKEADLSNYIDIDKGAWYYSEVAQGVSMGIVPNTNSNYLNPNQEATREYAAYMLCRAFGLTERADLSSYSDANQISDWALTSMQAMVYAKAITGADGKSGKTLMPQEIITRGEFASMIYNLTHDFVKESDSATIRGQTFNGGLVLSRGNSDLTNVTVNGNLYITDAIGTGSVTLDDTTVTGNIYVRGGGSNAIKLQGKSKANSIVMLNPYNASGATVEDPAEVKGILVNNGVDEVTVSGKVGNVTLNVSDVDLVFAKATADTVLINSKNANIAVDKDSTLTAMSLVNSSTGVTVDAKGKITRLATMSDDASLKLQGPLDYLLIGAVNNLKLEMDSSIELEALDIHASNSDITLNNKINSLTVSGFSENLKLTLGKTSNIGTLTLGSATTELKTEAGAVINNMVLNAAGTKITIPNSLDSLIVNAGANNSEITVPKGVDITHIACYASNVKFIFEDGSSVDDMSISGEKVEVTGKGSVGHILVSATANDGSVTTPNTPVTNAGAKNFKVGKEIIPTGKTYTTDATGADVVRNKDGTPDTDGDPNTGAAEENIIRSEFKIAYASGLTSQQIDPSGTWSLSDLGDNLALTSSIDTEGVLSYKITGNLKNVPNFTPVYDPVAGYGSGYYIPVVVTGEGITADGSFTVQGNGKTYTKADLKNGQLIVYLQLSPAANPRKVSLTVDRDGEGTVYGPTSVSIDYSSVTFDNIQDSQGAIISYPMNATAKELTSDGAYELKDFGTFSVVTPDGSKTATVTGTALALPSVPNGNVANDETKYYVPLLIDTTTFKDNWTVVADTQERFYSSNVLTSGPYAGKLLILVGIKANNAPTTIYLDANGDGIADTDGVYTINVANVALKDATTPVIPGDIGGEVSYPSDAQPADLTTEGQLTLADFGDFQVLSAIDSTASVRTMNVTVTGTYNNLATAQFTGHLIGEQDSYVPVAIDVSKWPENWSLNFSPYGRTYTAADAKDGRLILLVACNSSITYDAMADIDHNGTTDLIYKFDTTQVTESKPTVVYTDNFGYPTNATPAQLTKEGKLALADLGTFDIKYTPASTTAPVTGAEITVDGDVLPVEGAADLTGNIVHADGEVGFIPFLVDTSNWAEGWTFGVGTSKTFTAADAVADGEYKGQLIFLMGYTEGMGANVFYADRDGDGTNDAQYKLSLPHVTFNGGNPVNPNIGRFIITYPTGITPEELNGIDVSKFGTFTIADGENNLTNVTGEAVYQDAIPEGVNVAHKDANYFVPIAIDARNFDEGWTVEFLDVTYGQADVQKDGVYKGQLVVFLGIGADSSVFTFNAVEDDGTKRLETTFDASKVVLKEKEPEKDPYDLSTLEFIYPEGITADCLCGLNLADFGAYTLQKSEDGLTYTITGTSPKMDVTLEGSNLINTTNATHFLPVLLDVRGLEYDWYTLCSGIAYTQGSVIQDGIYKGYLPFIIGLTEDAKTFTFRMNDPNNTTLTIDASAVTLKEPEGDELIGEVPEGVEVKLDNKAYTVKIFDHNHVLKPELQEGQDPTEIVLDEAKSVEAIKAQMKADGYTNIQVTQNLQKKYVFSGIKSGVPLIFNWDPEKDYAQMIAISYDFGSGEQPYDMPEGSSIDDLLTALGEAAQKVAGDYVLAPVPEPEETAPGIPTEPQPEAGENYVEKAQFAKTTLIKDGKYEFGFYKLTLPKDGAEDGKFSVTEDGLTLTMEAPTEEGYYKKGDKIDMAFKIEGEGTVTTGSKKLVIGATNATMEFTPAAPDIKGNEAIKSLTITTDKQESLDKEIKEGSACLVLETSTASKKSAALSFKVTLTVGEGSPEIILTHSASEAA